MSDDHLITNDDDWLDLRVGETGTVLGKLESVGYGSPGTLIITFADWSQLVIECDSPRDAKAIPLSTQVRVRVRRTEDGLTAIGMIPAAGGVPAPLAAPST